VAHALTPSRLLARFAVLVVAFVFTSLALATAGRAGDLSGTWEGFYEYGNGQPPVYFLMVIEHGGSNVSGSIMEVQTFGEQVSDGLLSANISGRTTGPTVVFTKTYDGSGGVAHSVVYRGTLVKTDDGVSILAGTWETGGMQGGWMASLVD